MKITHLVTEFSPFIKVGGIADVLQGLAKQTLAQGYDIEVFLPKYDTLDLSYLEDLALLDDKVVVSLHKKKYKNKIWRGYFEKVPIFLVEPHKSLDLFERGTVYGCPDDSLRFLFFNRTVLEYLAKIDACPKIFHLHDWHTAITAPLYYEEYQKRFSTQGRIVFTIHNLGYQGISTLEDFEALDIDGQKLLQADKLQDMFDHEKLNLLKGGIVYSNFVTTVSPRYAEEALTPEGGKGLDSLLHFYQGKFLGILNSIDTSYWNPETDPALPVHFKASDSTGLIISKKQELKRHLCARFGMEFHEKKPLVASISRLVPQKGLELIEHTIFKASENDAQLFLLGETVIPEVLGHFTEIADEFADNPNIHLELRYCEDLAHLVFAAADILIIPSIFEPCGLVQMIAMRYGTIPVARNTGGLSNTVFDIDYYQGTEVPNGYTFEDANIEGLDSALDRALSDWKNDPKKWQKLVRNTAHYDWSWKQSLKKFLSLYQELAESC